MNWRVVILSSLMPFAETSLIAQQFGSQPSVPTVDPDQQPNGLVPRPFFYAGAGLVGGGPRRFLSFAEGSYDNGRKTNDGDQPNLKGHDRGLDGAAYFFGSVLWGRSFLEPAVHNKLPGRAFLAFGRMDR
jgi:hypothetical protein